MITKRTQLTKISHGTITKTQKQTIIILIPESSFSDFSIKGGSLTKRSNLGRLKGSSFGIKASLLEEQVIVVEANLAEEEEEEGVR